MPYVQWSEMPDGVGYTPAGKTVAELKPGYYDLASVNGTIFFLPVRARSDDLLRFPDSASLEVLEGISDFWDREPIFRKYGLPFKRGILLYGPPGSGKTCTLQLIAREVVERGGIVITFEPNLFLPAYRALRDIQPDTSVVVLMEDFESLMTNESSRSRLLNLLDGVEELHKVVFLATTNYPEKLEDRIINRPSRFDLRIRVDHPGTDARRLYLESLVHEEDNINIDQCVADTEGLSLAHLKELFVATHILGGGYDKTVQRLRSMSIDRVSSVDDKRPKGVGPFGSYV